ncbi:carboxylesterase [Auricularia subglabra TFB-10046 SS5]|nr:carboxylesterase [Auricularia subglabra TFB-10046 SS5]
MAPRFTHLSQELEQTATPVEVATRYGPVIGGTAVNGAAVFLELPYALPPGRFQDPVPLPDDYRYSDQPFVRESAYAAQPLNDGQAAGAPLEDRLGLGRATENPLFLNIVCPPQFKTSTNLPVKVYIHGGFLQFGSPHGVAHQAQYVACERGEVRVNIGYRLSAFGFISSDRPYLPGNYGFKDQWLALDWVRENIASFSGDPSNVQVLGLSAGAHSCHQLLHYASRLPDNATAPFQSAVLMSNAILLNPKSPPELRAQYQALLRAVNIDPADHNAFSRLLDPDQVSADEITSAIDEERLGAGMGTFRGCTDSQWMKPDPMGWQRSGGLAAGLKAHGVNFVVFGDLIDEWYLYSIAHPISTLQDVTDNLKRYYPADMVEKMEKQFPELPKDADEETCARRFGDILSEGQVYLPVRMLARDLRASNFPFVRYSIEWTPPAVRPKGLVTHATDRPLWGLRHDMLDSSELEVGRAWLSAVGTASSEVLDDGAVKRGTDEVLTLMPDKSIRWAKDERWARMSELADHLGI